MKELPPLTEISLKMSGVSEEEAAADHWRVRMLYQTLMNVPAPRDVLSSACLSVFGTFVINEFREMRTNGHSRERLLELKDMMFEAIDGIKDLINTAFLEQVSQMNPPDPPGN